MDNSSRPAALIAARTRRFAVECVRFFDALPSREAYRVVGRQLMRASTSVGANYRAAQRGRPRAEFIAKLGIVVEEADECGYWLDLLTDLGAGEAVERGRLRQEADELAAITFSALRSARASGVRKGRG